MSSPESKPVPTVFSYLRFSSAEQRKGDSLRRQREASSRWVESKGYTLDRKLHLTDRGVSAWSGDNAETGRLKAFLDHVDAGKVPAGSILLVENLDRLSRQKVRKALELFLGILNRGVTIQTLYPETTFAPDDTDEISLITAIVVLSRAHGESEMKSVRSRANWTKRRDEALQGEQILTGRCPLWMRPKKDRKGFELIPDRAKIVEDIFTQTVAGLGIVLLTNYLQATYPKALGGHGIVWSKTSIRRILTDRSSIGELQPHIKRDGKRKPIGDPVPHYYPAAVSEDLFYRAQDSRAKNFKQRGRKSPKCSNLFTGLVHDACGKHFVVIEKDIRYLLTYDAWRGLEPYQAFPYLPFEMGMLMAIAELRGQGVEEQANLSATDELNALLGREKEVAERVKATKKRLTSGAFSETLLEVAEVLDGQANEIRQKIADTKARIKATSGYSDLYTLVDTLHGPTAPTGDELYKLREKTKLQIRDLVKIVTVEYYSIHRFKKWLFADVELVSGRHQYMVLGHQRNRDPLYMLVQTEEGYLETIAEVKEHGGFVI